MKNESTTYRLILAFAVAGCLILSYLGCSKKEEEGRISPKQKSGLVAKADYAKILTDIERLQEQIRQNPADAELHSKLVELAVDSTAGVLRAAGKGEPPLQAKSAVIARQAAQEAAYIDACQWIAYLLEWKKHPDDPEFGKIQAELPGTRQVHKLEESDVTKVLVEIDLP